MNVAIMGYGIVGSGVAELINKKHESIAQRSQHEQLQLKYILDLRDFPGDPNAHLVIHDFETIRADDSVKVVVETMGGLHPAFEFVQACLEAGKSVVTSNKELVAEKGYELLQTADANNVNFLFEASVGGGIPIIRPISQCLAANQIDEIAGILNGTTNFILSKMIFDGMDFAEALALAQQNGYAEKDPTADVEGHDACRKICILASLCFGKHVYPNEVHTEGISALTLADVQYAKNWGGVIKLLGQAKRLPDGRISAIVCPCFIKQQSQLAGVNDVFNAILVRGDAIGDVVFYGRGAGKMPTASAVVADVLDCGKHLEKKRGIGWENSEEGYVANYQDSRTALYIRGTAQDPAAVLAQVERTFGAVQVLFCEGAPREELAFVTAQATERELRTKLATILGLQVQSVIRVTEY